ncbi:MULTISPECIES: DUF1330 domain-containing protein [unclassified Duganella]|uniref:DUF1330 domain-containing protein n=1 Tax=unclassified Duganella TaxID=2636909 RepID=UPI000E34D4C1|nr:MULTISPECIES: DUF1330 domain-containing protein [unclassified Duganella]RFP18694.1 DUF1330 domain-containing protein [Duganella sp. BJB475]RFP35359.1 DUF1330 domain-containing protein [Duganella sp. BJB476]
MQQAIIRVAAAATLALAVLSNAQAQAATVPPAAQPHGYMVVTYDIKDQAAFQKYMDAAGSLAGKYNGKVIVFNMKTQAVEGKSRFIIGIAEFPSLAEAERFYYSPEYTEARKFRAAATGGTSTVILTEGLPQQ